MSNDMNWMRRKFLQASSLLGAGFLLNRTASAQHEGHQMPAQPQKDGKAKTVKPAQPEHDYQKMLAEHAKRASCQYLPVQTPDLPKLEYTLDNGVKVFNLRAEVVECELMPKSHTHGPMQEMLGMIGLFVIHPKVPHTPRVDKDYGFVLQEWALCTHRAHRLHI